MVEYVTNNVESTRFIKMVKKPSHIIRAPRTDYRSTLSRQGADNFNLPLNLPKVLSSWSMSPERSLKSSASSERVSIHPSDDASKSGLSAKFVDVHSSALPNRPRIGQARLVRKLI